MWVVPAFDEFKHRPTGLFLRAEGATVQHFTLQRGEEAAVNPDSWTGLDPRNCVKAITMAAESR
jgi:hypothetical protein